MLHLIGWQCYGLKRDDGATFWYVRDRNNRITDGCATPEQAIESAINRAQELNRKLAAGKTPSDQVKEITNDRPLDERTAG
jgi:hypothetical protein